MSDYLKNPKDQFEPAYSDSSYSRKRAGSKSPRGGKSP